MVNITNNDSWRSVFSADAGTSLEAWVNGVGQGSGWFSKVHVWNFLPDPGALNSCTRAFPATYV